MAYKSKRTTFSNFCDSFWLVSFNLKPSNIHEYCYHTICKDCIRYLYEFFFLSLKDSKKFYILGSQFNEGCVRLPPPRLVQTSLKKKITCKQHLQNTACKKQKKNSKKVTLNISHIPKVSFPSLLLNMKFL